MIHKCSSCKEIIQPEDGVLPIGKITHSFCANCVKIINLNLDLKEGDEQMKKLSNKLDEEIKAKRIEHEKSRQLNIRMKMSLAERAIAKAKAEYRSFTNYVHSLIMADLREDGNK